MVLLYFLFSENICFVLYASCTYYRLASYDVVLTTYNIIAKEVVVDDTDKNGEKPVKDDVENEEPNASEVLDMFF